MQRHNEKPTIFINCDTSGTHCEILTLRYKILLLLLLLLLILPLTISDWNVNKIIKLIINNLTQLILQ